MLIDVNLSSNAYPTSVLPHPGFDFRQNRGGVTRRMMVSETSGYHKLLRLQIASQA
ncbi:MAG: hypothetical protein V7L22_28330 [Nostoc sp.]|uniref:hypothetical protein n=1 Tax=Nostoc sp. TaxID=1180 RepID=UPI002FF6ADCE